MGGCLAAFYVGGGVKKCMVLHPGFQKIICIIKCQLIFVLFCKSTCVQHTRNIFIRMFLRCNATNIFRCVDEVREAPI